MLDTEKGRSLYLDTETIGLSGNVKLIQYSYGLKDSVHFIRLFKGWEGRPAIRKQLYELWDILNKPETIFIGYNTQFDLFKLYQTFHRLEGYEYDSYERPIEPFKCQTLDLQVVAMQKSILSPFAFKKPGKSIARINRVPLEAADYVEGLVLEQLTKVIPESLPIKVGHHECEQDNLVSLSFDLDGRVSLKGIMKAYGLPTLKLDDVWLLPKEEKAYLTYPQEVHRELEPKLDEIMSDLTSPFYKYSKLDIVYLKILEEKLGNPKPDYNSELTHNGAYVKYYGFDIDFEALDRAEKYYGEKVERIEKRLSGINPRSAPQRLEFLKQHFPLLASTSKATLKALLKLEDADEKGVERVKALLEYGPARQKLVQIKAVKESLTKKAHPELRIMGTATNRMAGMSGINWQGIGAFEEEDISFFNLESFSDNEDIKHQNLEEILALENSLANAESKENKMRVGLRTAILTPMVGDWASFEVRIAAAVYEDEALTKVVKEGLDMHSYTTSIAHPDVLAYFKQHNIPEAERYEYVRKKYKADDSFFVKCRKQIKSVVFGIFYGAQAFTVSESLGITEGEAQRILDLFFKAYPGIKRYRDNIEKMFMTADTVNWSKTSINRMAVSLKDLTGFERRWDFEKELAKIFWNLGHKQLRTGINKRIVRDKNKGMQSVDNACRSALLGAALGIQSSASRQAVNFRVQATGSSIHKMLQGKLWVNHRVGSCQIHDEFFCINKGFDFNKIKEVVSQHEEEYGKVVPNLKFDYGKTERWSDK